MSTTTTTDTWQAVAREMAPLLRAAAEHARVEAARMEHTPGPSLQCEHCNRLRFADACEAALARFRAVWGVAE